jgi:hypothetical protein
LKVFSYEYIYDGIGDVYVVVEAFGGVGVITELYL